MNNVRFDLLHQIWEMLLGIEADPVARRHFNLESYLGSDAAAPNGLKTPAALFQHFQNNRATRNCGTVGCAMGYAKLCIPAIRRDSGICDYMFDGIEVSEFLGVGYGDVLDMFIPEPGYKSPRQVADRVKAVIEKYAA